MGEHQLGSNFIWTPQGHRTDAAASGRLRDAVESYIGGLMGSLRRNRPSGHTNGHDPDSLSGEIFRTLTSREFCYLSRKRTAPYAPEAMTLIRRAIDARKPIPFYFDIGAGYKASIVPGESELRFRPGLSELFMISQAMSFARRIDALYEHGIEFHFVIDNICALMTNDIPLVDTLGYVEHMRALIRETGVGDTIKLMVESEVCSLSQYDLEREAQNTAVPKGEPTEEDIENVERFLGRHCEPEEALARIQRYKLAGTITDRLLNAIIDGVHMTQRATPATLPFRPFPGGDSRTQCGEVVLTTNHKGHMCPTLMTSRNVANFLCVQMTFPNLLPPTVDQVTYAQPRDL